MASPWRKSVEIEKIAPLLVKAAVQLQIEGITDPKIFSDPGDTKQRKARGEVAMTIITESLEAVGKGVGGAIELDNRPEGFFQRSRTKAKGDEVMSQRDAIARYLEKEAGAEILLSEAELVTATIKAAKDLGHGTEYTVETLIRDGIRRVGQEMISNAVNRENRDPELAPAHTAPGARWDAYEEAYQELQAIVGTKAWSYRKPYITLSYIAGALKGPKSNVVQLKRWADATGRNIVPAPLADEDQSAGGQIVDDKMERNEG